MRIGNACFGQEIIDRQRSIPDGKKFEEEMKKAEKDSDTDVSDSEETEKKEEADTGAEIMVKPDGSRVLMVTTQIGGMETVMCLKVSEPTKLPNDNSRQDTDGANMAASEMNLPSGEMQRDMENTGLC